MAKRIVWTEQAKADVRAIEQPIALQILKTLARYAQAGEGVLWRGAVGLARGKEQESAGHHLRGEPHKDVPKRAPVEFGGAVGGKPERAAHPQQRQRQRGEHAVGSQPRAKDSENAEREDGEHPHDKRKQDRHRIAPVCGEGSSDGRTKVNQAANGAHHHSERTQRALH
jgi:hypothetical protein